MLIAVSTILSSPPTEKQRSSVENTEFPVKKFTKKMKFLKKGVDKILLPCYNKTIKEIKEIRTMYYDFIQVDELAIEDYFEIMAEIAKAQVESQK